MFGDDPVPDRKPMSREERIKAHRERVAVAMDVEGVIEGVDTGLSPEVLKLQIDDVRKDMAKKRAQMLMLESEEFGVLQKSLREKMLELKHLRVQYAEAVSRKLASTIKYGDAIKRIKDSLCAAKERRDKILRGLSREIEELKVLQKPVKEVLDEQVHRMMEFCIEHDVDFTDYVKDAVELELPVLKIDRRRYVRKETLSLPESLFNKDTIKTWRAWKIWLRDKGVCVTLDRSGIKIGEKLNGFQAKEALAECNVTITEGLLI